MVERRIEVPVETLRAPRHGEWIAILDQLRTQLARDQIYARDIAALAAALRDVNVELIRRQAIR